MWSKDFDTFESTKLLYIYIYIVLHERYSNPKWKKKKKKVLSRNRIDSIGKIFENDLRSLRSWITRGISSKDRSNNCPYRATFPRNICNAISKVFLSGHYNWLRTSTCSMKSPVQRTVRFKKKKKMSRILDNRPIFLDDEHKMGKIKKKREKEKRNKWKILVNLS